MDAWVYEPGCCVSCSARTAPEVIYTGPPEEVSARLAWLIGREGAPAAVTFGPDGSMSARVHVCHDCRIAPSPTRRAWLN